MIQIRQKNVSPPNTRSVGNFVVDCDPPKTVKFSVNFENSPSQQQKIKIDGLLGLPGTYFWHKKLIVE